MWGSRGSICRLIWEWTELSSWRLVHSTLFTVFTVAGSHFGEVWFCTVHNRPTQHGTKPVCPCNREHVRDDPVSWDWGLLTAFIFSRPLTWSNRHHPLHVPYNLSGNAHYLPWIISVLLSAWIICTKTFLCE